MGVDITSHATPETWLYLAIVFDLYSRKVIGWSSSSTKHRNFVIAALRAAIKSRRPKSDQIFRFDRPSEDASSEFPKLLKEHGFVVSMSGIGCCDIAVVESFFGSMNS
jgi:putative transposase